MIVLICSLGSLILIVTGCWLLARKDRVRLNKLEKLAKRGPRVRPGLLTPVEIYLLVDHETGKITRHFMIDHYPHDSLHPDRKFPGAHQFEGQGDTLREAIDKLADLGDPNEPWLGKTER